MACLHRRAHSATPGMSSRCANFQTTGTVSWLQRAWYCGDAWEMDAVSGTRALRATRRGHSELTVARKERQGVVSKRFPRSRLLGNYRGQSPEGLAVADADE